jgi:hypothetical protein
MDAQPKIRPHISRPFFISKQATRNPASGVGSFSRMVGWWEMTNYLWVVEIQKGREWVPYVARKRREDAELVKANNEKYSKDKYRVRKYVRRLE